jgi:hypothetical protein
MKTATRVRGLIGAAVISAVVLGACSGSGSGHGVAKGTTATSSPAEVASAVTAALGRGSASRSNSTSAASNTTLAGGVRALNVAPRVQLPTAPNVCELLTTLSASALLGTIRSTAAAVAGTTSSCTYASANAQAKLSITQASNPAVAHGYFILAERAAGRSARGAFLGDEGFSYPGGITLRTGGVLLNLTGSPPPSAGALETAAASVLKRI